MKKFFNTVITFFLLSFLSYKAPISLSSNSSHSNLTRFDSRIFEAKAENKFANMKCNNELYQKTDAENSQSLSDTSKIKKGFIVVFVLFLTGVIIYNFIYEEPSILNDIKI